MVVNNPYQYMFNGKEFQNELGLNFYDYGARNYDPALGRWMNTDPLAHRYSFNTPYSYAVNNPIYFIDPDGRKIKDGDAQKKNEVDKRIKRGESYINNLESRFGKSRKDFKNNAGDIWKSVYKNYTNAKEKIRELRRESNKLSSQSENTQAKIKELKEKAPKLFEKLDNAVNEHGEIVDVYFSSTDYLPGNDGQNNLAFDIDSDGKVRLTTSLFGVNTTEVVIVNKPSGNRTTLQVTKHELGHVDYNVENATAYLDFLQRIGILNANGSVLRSYDGHGKGDGSGQRANEYGAMKDLE